MALRARLFFGAVVIGLFALMTVATYTTLTRNFPGHNDFMSRWEGARSYWLEGLNPYGEVASLNIQERIYGRPVVEGEDPGYFVYPFYTVFVVGPTVIVDYAWASAFFMVLLEALLLAALFLLLDHFQWRPRVGLIFALILFTLLVYFSARGLLLGQLGHLVYFTTVLTLWGLGQKRDSVAGVALAISTIKPQMGFLIVPFLLLWGMREARWRFVGAFAVSFGALMGVSFLLQPSWLSDWLYQVNLYPGYTDYGGPLWVIAHYPWLEINPMTGRGEVVGGFGNVIELALIVPVALLMLASWVPVLWRRDQTRFMWTVVLTLVATHLIAPRTATPHYVVFFIPLIFYLREIVQRARWGRLLAYALLAVLLMVPWAHHLTTIVADIEHPSLFVPYPLVLLAVLWWTRHRWWQDQRDVFQQG